jgi:hypothetical protein
MVNSSAFDVNIAILIGIGFGWKPGSDPTVSIIR